MTALAARRRHPLATVVLVLRRPARHRRWLYAAVDPDRARAPPQASADDIAAGRQALPGQLRHLPRPQRRGRATNAPVPDRRRRRRRRLPGRHRPDAAGRDRRRRPPRKPGRASPTSEIEQLAAYVAVAGPRPGRSPTAEQVDPAKGDAVPRRRALPHQLRHVPQLRRRGRRADPRQVRARPDRGRRPTHIYEAMLTGPQTMPVFNDATLDPAEQARHHRLPRTPSTERRRRAAWTWASSARSARACSPGWSASALLIGCAVWIGAKAS